jgi:hypothetical protein
MYKIKYAWLILTGLTIFSCQQRINLQSDKDLNEVFTASEVKEIEKMIHYVDDRVIEITGNKGIEEAYHQLIDKINQTMQDSATFFVPFEEEAKYKFLESIDTTVFNEFWYMSNHIRKTIYKESIYENLDNYKLLELKRNGKFSDYLERIGKNDAYFKSVKETLDMAGGLAPSIVASFLKIHTEFDFTMPKNRLWATVFILTIEEPHDKKMERYLNQK